MILWIVGIFVAMTLLFGVSSCQKVPAGHVGVLVHLLGSDKGVDSEEVPIGRKFVGINEELYLFPTYTQNDTWTKDSSITFQTKEGLNVNTDLGISYHVDPKKVTLVFQKYRKGIEEISHIYLRNIVQDALVRAASSKDVESIYGQGKTELLTEVENVVRNEVGDIGLSIEHLYWVGTLRLPDNVVAAINAKIGATQMAAQRENEIQQTRAEAQKAIEAARGEAESKLAVARADAEAVRIRGEAEADAINAKTRAISSNPNLTQYEIAQKWDGVLPTTTFGASSVPMLNLSK